MVKLSVSGVSSDNEVGGAISPMLLVIVIETLPVKIRRAAVPPLMLTV